MKRMLGRRMSRVKGLGYARQPSGCRSQRVPRSAGATASFGCLRTSRRRCCWAWSRRTSPTSCALAKASRLWAAPNVGGAEVRPGEPCPTSKYLCWWHATSAGATTDFILEVVNKAHELAVLAPVLPSDTVLARMVAARWPLSLGTWTSNTTCSTCPAALAFRGRGTSRTSSRITAGSRWMRRFQGVATSYFAIYLGRFSARDRTARTPSQHPSMLTLGFGAGRRHQSLRKEPIKMRPACRSLHGRTSGCRLYQNVYFAPSVKKRPTAPA